jgi:hypothetical protein
LPRSGIALAWDAILISWICSVGRAARRPVGFHLDDHYSP